MIKFYLLFLSLTIPTYVFSQINGNVFCKQTGKSISGATIVLAKNGKPTRLKTTSLPDGSFSITSPAAGTYQLWVEHTGYKFYSYEVLVYRQSAKLLLSPIELEQISAGSAKQ